MYPDKRPRDTVIYSDSKLTKCSLQVRHLGYPILLRKKNKLNPSFPEEEMRFSFPCISDFLLLGILFKKN